MDEQPNLIETPAKPADAARLRRGGLAMAIQHVYTRRRQAFRAADDHEAEDRVIAQFAPVVAALRELERTYGAAGEDEPVEDKP